MALSALILTALLTQTPEPEATPAPAPEAPTEAAATDPAPSEAPKPKAFTFKPGTLTRPEDIAKELEKVHGLPPAEQAQKMQELMKRLPDVRGMAPAGFQGETYANYLALPEGEQASVVARHFFNQLIAGNARAVTEAAALPFQLEDRRVNSGDELFQEWVKALRSKRSDLLTLYGIEMLSPAEMEKKYGKPPARLSNLPWKNSKTVIAVANLSGHAAVAVLKQHPSGIGWQVVAYHD